MILDWEDWIGRTGLDGYDLCGMIIGVWMYYIDTLFMWRNNVQYSCQDSQDSQGKVNSTLNIAFVYPPPALPLYKLPEPVNLTTTVVVYNLYTKLN